MRFAVLFLLNLPFIFYTACVCANGLPANPWSGNDVKVIYNNVQETNQQIQNAVDNFNPQDIEDAFYRMQNNYQPQTQKNSSQDIVKSMEDIWNKYSNTDNTAQAREEKSNAEQKITDFFKELNKSSTKNTSKTSDFNFDEFRELSQQYKNYKNKIQNGYNTIKNTTNKAVKTLEKESGINLQNIVNDTQKMLK